MFNFGVVRTRNYDYEQQIPNITHSIYNSWQHRQSDDGLPSCEQLWSDTKVEQEAVLTCEHILYFKPDYLPMGCLGEDLNAAKESAMPTS